MALDVDVARLVTQITLRMDWPDWHVGLGVVGTRTVVESLSPDRVTLGAVGTRAIARVGEQHVVQHHLGVCLPDTVE